MSGAAARIRFIERISGKLRNMYAHADVFHREALLMIVKLECYRFFEEQESLYVSNEADLEMADGIREELEHLCEHIGTARMNEGDQKKLVEKVMRRAHQFFDNIPPVDINKIVSDVTAKLDIGNEEIKYERALAQLLELRRFTDPPAPPKRKSRKARKAQKSRKGRKLARSRRA